MPAWHFLIRKLIKKGWRTTDVWSFGFHPAVCRLARKVWLIPSFREEGEIIVRLRGGKDATDPRHERGAVVLASSMTFSAHRLAGFLHHTGPCHFGVWRSWVHYPEESMVLISHWLTG